MIIIKKLEAKKELANWLTPCNLWRTQGAPPRRRSGTVLRRGSGQGAPLLEYKIGMSFKIIQNSTHMRSEKIGQRVCPNANPDLLFFTVSSYRMIPPYIYYDQSRKYKTKKMIADNTISQKTIQTGHGFSCL